MSHEILIVDDEKNIRRSLRGFLEDEGYAVDDAASGEDAIESVKKNFYRVVFLDVLLPGLDGIAVLKEIQKISPETSVIVMSGHASIEMAIEATRCGAYNFFEKPLIAEKILLELEHLKIHRTMAAEVVELRRLAGHDEMIGDSKPMQELRRLIARISPTDGRVLITGENGTGKELVARAVHYNSLRSGKPFVTINCAALPKDLIESELFGYEKGAFTGATSRKIGQIEMAHTGTLFLDEIGDMSLDTQAKLLRVLEENEFVRLSGSKPVSFDVRILSATNQDIEKKIGEGTFREDLYHRLRVIPIDVPPLRDHREDIPALVNHFAAHFAEKNGKRALQFDADALRLMQDQRWHGNIRELKNVIERTAIMVESGTVTSGDVAPYLPGAAPDTQPATSGVPELNGRSLREVIATFDEAMLTREYERCRGNVSRVAANLKIDRANLHRKLKLLGIK